MERLGFTCTFIAYFHILGLFKKTCFGRKIVFPSVTPKISVRCWTKFEISATLSLLSWALHTQNFEILKSLEQTLESKIFITRFEIFVKMLNGSNFG
jgi:hypothetical protein